MASVTRHLKFLDVMLMARECLMPRTQNLACLLQGQSWHDHWRNSRKGDMGRVTWPNHFGGL